MADKNPSKTEILGTVQAQSETLKDLSERFVKIETLIEKQESRNQNIIYAVLVALVFIIVSIGAEILLSNKSDLSYLNSFTDKLLNTKDEINIKMDSIDNQLIDLKNQFLLLKVKNPYLK